MNLQRPHRGQASLGLQDTCTYAKTAEFLMNTGNSPELMDGHTLALYQVNGPHDVYYPAWEMHPDATEAVTGAPSCRALCRA